MAKIQNGKPLAFIAVYIPIAICQWGWPKRGGAPRLIAVKC